MKRSTVESWLEGPGDLDTRVIEDVPVKGESVMVTGLPAAYSAEIASQMTLVNEGNVQVAKVDKAKMEILEFVHGVVEPKFSKAQAQQVAEKYGPAFNRVIEAIDELSAIDKEEIEKAEVRFPARDDDAAGSGGGQNGSSTGSGGPDLPLRVGAGAPDAD